MADEWIDKDGNAHPDRRTGDSWRRHFHGRMDRVEKRLDDGEGTMSTLARDIRTFSEEARDRDRILGAQIAHNTTITETGNKMLEPIATVFKDTKTAARMVRAFQAWDGTHTLAINILKFLALIGGAGAGIAVIVWVVITLGKAAK